MNKYTCSTCGKEFERYPSAMSRRKGEGAYCSRSCAAKRQQKELPDLLCSQCGKTFYRSPAERKLNNNYCSRTCANQAQSRAIQDAPNLRTTEGTEVKCIHCGNSFYVKPHRHKKAKYCSRACFHAQRFGRSLRAGEKNIEGTNNPNYKGTSNLVTARLTGRKHLGTKCMICGWDEITDIHHIIPRRHGGTNNIENLIVLCPNHHRLADIGRISQAELFNITRVAIAQLSGLPPQSDQQERD